MYYLKNNTNILEIWLGDFSKFLIQLTPNNQVKHVVDEKPTVVLEIEDKDVTNVKEERPPSPSPPEPVKEEKPVTKVPDLLVSS